MTASREEKNYARRVVRHLAKHYADAECALNYFIKKKISKKYWKKDCLKEGVLNRRIDNWSPIN